MSRRIEDLIDYMQEPTRRLLERAKFGNWHAFITSGFRTVEEQNDLYAQGRTKPGKKVTYSRGGQSDHNFGRAIDIGFKNQNDELNWDDSLFERAAVIAKQLGFSWGGDWLFFKDKPHFYMPKLPYDQKFINKWNFRFILDVDDLGRVYYIFEGKRYYVSPKESLEEFAKKFATGFRHSDVMRIPPGE